MHTPIRVAVLWHDTVTHEIMSRKPVKIGEGLRCDLVLPDVAGIGDAHALLTPDGEGGWLLRPTAEMTGTLERAGRSEPLDAARPTSLTDGDWGQLDLGPVGLFFRVGAESAQLPTGAMLTAVEAPMLGSLLGALTVHLALLIGAFLLYDEKPNLNPLDIEIREAWINQQAPQQEIEHEMEVESVTDDIASAPPEDEGKFGKPEAPEKPVKQRDSKFVDGIRQKALFRGLNQGAVSRVLGRKDSFIDSLDHATSGLDDGAVTTRGDGGLGLRNLGGPGGGGRGPHGVIGGTDYTGLAGGQGIRTRSRLRTRKKRKPTFRPQPPTLSGGGFCKPGDIQRVVKLRARGVQYCYEKALKAKPELSGKLMVSWRIGLDGRVLKARVESNGLGDREVAGCVTRAIKRWRFQKPEGGMCQVRYPFVFSSGL